MDQMVTFVRNDVMPSWWANSIQRFLSGVAENFRLTQLSATTVRIPASSALPAVIAIQGKWRYMESNVDRVISGAAATYGLYVVAAANTIVNTPATGTDNTDYSFSLQFASSPPAGALVKQVGEVVWDGAQITSVRDFIRPVGPSQIEAGSILARHIGASIIDAVAGAPSLRTLGSGSQQAAPGNSPGLTPIGGIIEWAGIGDASPQLVVPNGRALSKTTYAALFAVLGIRYGGTSGGTTFNLPNVLGASTFHPRDPGGTDALTGSAHTARASGNDGVEGTLGQRVGEVLHTLTAAESGLPAHSVNGNTTGISGTVSDPNFGFVYVNNIAGTFIGGGGVGVGTSHTLGLNLSDPGHGHSVSAAAAAQGHNTVHPSVGLNKLIRIA